MAKDILVPEYGMFCDESVNDYLIPEYGIFGGVTALIPATNDLEVAIELGSVNLGVGLIMEDLEVATELGAVTLVYHPPGGGCRKWSMFLLMRRRR